jgi:hypothetical protein
MQPTELQVQRSLEALQQADLDTTDTRDGHGAGDLPNDVLERLSEQPAVRPDRLAEARQRLADGEQPSAEALAQRMVGRLVCDRLR